MLGPRRRAVVGAEPRAQTAREYDGERCAHQAARRNPCTTRRTS